MKQTSSFNGFVFFFFLLLFIISFSGCGKKEIVSAPATNTITSPYYIIGKLGDEEILVQNTPSYYTNITNQNPEENDDDDDDDDKSTLVTGCSWPGTNGSGNISSNATVEFRKEVFRIYVTPFTTTVNYYDMVATGIYPFAHGNHGSNGVYFAVTDKNGVLWTTKGNQHESSFEILSRGSNGQNSTNITGTIHCNLYDGNGNVKKFTSGTFSAIVGL